MDIISLPPCSRRSDMDHDLQTTGASPALQFSKTFLTVSSKLLQQKNHAKI